MLVRGTKIKQEPIEKYFPSFGEFEGRIKINKKITIEIKEKDDKDKNK